MVWAKSYQLWLGHVVEPERILISCRQVATLVGHGLGYDALRWPHAPRLASPVRLLVSGPLLGRLTGHLCGVFSHVPRFRHLSARVFDGRFGVATGLAGASLGLADACIDLPLDVGDVAVSVLLGPLTLGGHVFVGLPLRFGHDLLRALVCLFSGTADVLRAGVTHDVDLF